MDKGEGVDSSISSKRVVINSNSKSVCKTCNKCLNSANHEMCVANILSSVNATPTVKIVLNKGKQIWKPKGKLSDNSLNKSKQVWKATGKIFALFGYEWRPTGKNSLRKTLVGYQWRTTGKKFALGRTGRPLVSGLRFENDHFGAIMGYGDYVIGDSVISRVYYMEDFTYGVIHSHPLFVTISIDDMMKSSPVCLLSKASKTKSWLWHRRLNHLNFGTINDLARKDLVRGLPRLKFEKDHLCSACQLGKSKKYSHKPKSKNTNMEVLYTLHMDLCGPMRVQSINGKKYILVIVDDYSRFTWVKFLRSKDETPEFVINFLKQIQVGLNKTVRYIRTDNGTEFVNQMKSYTCGSSTYNADILKSADVSVGSSCRYCLLHPEPIPNSYSSQQNPYELVHDKKPDLTFLRVFGALCYPTNDSEDLGKLQAKADIGILVGYAPNRKGF
ncbi:retrovirus-related pol polyprotein from transposon TNT 1-94 [Tanacetum coccineum]